MEFVRVLKNEEKGECNGHKTACKQAIFLQPESGQHYLYSYVDNQYAHETMVFECDADGDSAMRDLVITHGYEHSSKMMERLAETLA